MNWHTLLNVVGFVLVILGVLGWVGERFGPRWFVVVLLAILAVIVVAMIATPRSAVVAMPAAVRFTGAPASGNLPRLTGAPLRLPGETFGVEFAADPGPHGAARYAALEETGVGSPAEFDLATTGRRLGGAPLAAVTYTGTLAYADASLGRYYLGMLVGLAVATPRAATQQGELASAKAVSAASHVGWQLGAPRCCPESVPQGSSSAGGRDAPQPRTEAPGASLFGAVTYTGTLAYADRSLGRYYLALREPRGTRVEVCGPAACLERVSTDYGPVLSLWEAGRIADVSYQDFETLCGVPHRFGLCPGSIEILHRSRTPLPATDMEETE